jgi:hypothetical protein
MRPQVLRMLTVTVGHRHTRAPASGAALNRDPRQSVVCG